MMVLRFVGATVFLAASVVLLMVVSQILLLWLMDLPFMPRSHHTAFPIALTVHSLVLIPIAILASIWYGRAPRPGLRLAILVHMVVGFYPGVIVAPFVRRNRAAELAAPDGTPAPTILLL